MFKIEFQVQAQFRMLANAKVVSFFAVRFSFLEKFFFTRSRKYFHTRHRKFDFLPLRQRVTCSWRCAMIGRQTPLSPIAREGFMIKFKTGSDSSLSLINVIDSDITGRRPESVRFWQTVKIDCGLLGLVMIDRSACTTIIFCMKWRV